MIKAIYPGTFDPLTRGHDIILILQGDIDDRVAHRAKPAEYVCMT